MCASYIDLAFFCSLETTKWLTVVERLLWFVVCCCDASLVSPIHFKSKACVEMRIHQGTIGLFLDHCKFFECTNLCVFNFSYYKFIGFNGGTENDFSLGILSKRVFKNVQLLTTKTFMNFCELFQFHSAESWYFVFKWAHTFSQLICDCSYYVIGHVMICFVWCLLFV